MAVLGIGGTGDQAPMQDGPSSWKDATAWLRSPQGIGSSPMIPSFKEGGYVGPGGIPFRPGQGAAPQGLVAQPQERGPGRPPPNDPKMLEMQIEQFASQHPQELQGIRNAVEDALQSGELTPEELNTAIQLAKVALNNPQSYAQVRQYAIQQGIGTEADIPAEYDEGLLIALLAVGRALSAGQMGNIPPQTQDAPEGGAVPSMRKGGLVTQKGDADGGVLAKIHERGYVIPADVVMYHGTKNLDAMIEKARNPNGAKSAKPRA